MFEKLFVRPAAITRYKQAPYAKEREAYLAHCTQEGYAIATLMETASTLVLVVRELGAFRDRPITLAQVKAAATRWLKKDPKPSRSLRRRYEHFVRTATQWLRFLGRLCVPVGKPVPFAGLLDDFTTWMAAERGLSSATIRQREWHLRKFLSWYGKRRQPLAEVKVQDVDSFLTACGARGCGRGTLRITAAALRAFFRYAARRGECPASLSEAIEGPCVFRQETLPAGPAWDEVRRLVASFGSDRPCDVRNRALVLLLATYGLRAGEVCALRLEDLDWGKRRILVRRSKQRGSQVYPLAPTVGDAIERYIKTTRPVCPFQELFVTLRAPRRPITRGVIGQVISQRLQKLGIETLHHGPHALRHACAGHLVTNGFSLKEIGDHLGHRSPQSTAIYAKVDLPGLREVAAFDLGGLL